MSTSVSMSFIAQSTLIVRCYPGGSGRVASSASREPHPPLGERLQGAGWREGGEETEGGLFVGVD